MSDSQLVEKLPLIFRTMRGKKVTDKQLDELAEVIEEVLGDRTASYPVSFL